MASIKLCLLGLLVFAMLSVPRTWARKEDSTSGKTFVVRETIINNVDLPKMEKMIEELSGNAKNVIIREVTSDVTTSDNLKCKNKFEQCMSMEECCSGVCIVHPIYPPVPGRCV